MATKHYRHWRVRWVDEHGKRQSRTFDKHADAVEFEHEEKSRVERVRRGVALARPVPHTFDELCDAWLKNRAPQKRSAKDDQSIIRCHLRPAFGALLLSALGIEQVDRFIVTLGSKSKHTLSNILTLLIAMLNYARDLGWLERVPRIRKPTIRLGDFQYLRTDDEIRRVLEAARAEGELVFALYTCAIDTGMRAGELAALRWEDVDFERRLITVQRSFDGPTKAEDVRYVPILDALLPVLRAWRLLCPGELVFPNYADHMHAPSAAIFQEVLHRVLTRAGFPKVMRNGKERWYVSFHGFRHSFASHWMMRGGDLFKLQKILGHKSVQMTLRYSHLSPHAFVDDYGLFKGHSSEPATVVRLRVAG
jgi:integrase